MFERRMSSNSNSSFSTPKKIKQEPSGDTPTSPTISRYGRSHKPKIQDDFVSTDKKVSAYLKVSPGNQIQHYNVQREYYKKKTSPKKVSPDSYRTPKRGRPPKSPNVKTLDKEIKLKAVVKPEPQDPSSPVQGCEWMVGDLAWGRVGGHPFWPCIIAVDPEHKIFTKTINKGRGSVSQRWIHVQFFGDNGRRSWLNATSIMSYNGRDAFVQLGETILAGMRKKEPKQTSAFVIKPAVLQVWEKAAHEAEDLLNATREERVAFFTLHFPPPKLQLTKARVLEQLESVSPPPVIKKVNRKRKAESSPAEEAVQKKQLKLEDTEVKEENNEKSGMVDPLSTTPRTIADRKKRQALLMQMARSNSQSPNVTDMSITPSSPTTAKKESQTPDVASQTLLKSAEAVVDVEAYVHFFSAQSQCEKSSIDEKFEEIVKEIFF